MKKAEKFRGIKTILTLILFFFPALLFPQEKEIKNLIFEGGGIRGLAFAGALEVLEEKNIIEGVEKVGGTSAGAITALMISLGYQSQEVFEILSDTKFHSFNDGRFLFIGGMHRLRKHFGWYRGEKFVHWLEDVIEQKTGDKDITFAELPGQGYKEFSAVATCLNQQKRIVLSKETYPDMKVKDAIRISMSVPFYFQAVFIDKKGNVFDEPAEGLDIVVDGGLIGNYPMFLFDEITLDKNGREQRTANPESLGFRIDEPQQISSDENSRELVPYEISSFKDYLMSFYNLTLESLNRSQLTPEDWERTVKISSAGIGPKIKKMSSEQLERLFASGENSTRTYFE